MARILVVEDDPDQLEMRRLILEQAGHQVVSAQTASEALQHLPGCQIVLMDLRLPFDDIPGGWNNQMPQLVIARIEFA